MNLKIRKVKNYIFISFGLVILFYFLFFYKSKVDIESCHFDFFLNEPCMILNIEQENSIEGTYITVKEIDKKNNRIRISKIENFFLNSNNCKNWFFGWGKEIPLYDAGVENLRTIQKIGNDGWVYFGKTLRGMGGLPKLNQRIVFWNRDPSGFRNQLSKPIISEKIWPNFNGESLAFGSVIFDEKLNRWVIITFECDSPIVDIYAASSRNLIDWRAENNGNAILKSTSFKNCSWAGRDKSGKRMQSPYVSDIIKYKGKWILILDGYDKNGLRNIGYAESNSILGPYKISLNPIITPKMTGGWANESVFYGKIKENGGQFYLFFDGRNKSGLERVGVAKSKNLKNWNICQKPVIDGHHGWRSNEGSSEPNYVEFRGDSIFLMIAGIKKFKMGFWHHYITKRMYKDVSGNVDDAQLGLFLSTDDAKSFVPHKNNPIFTNDYSNKFENDHMGGNFALIHTDTSDFVIYQAKSMFNGSKYSILLREKKLKNVVKKNKY